MDTIVLMWSTNGGIQREKDFLMLKSTAKICRITTLQRLLNQKTGPFTTMVKELLLQYLSLMLISNELPSCSKHSLSLTNKRFLFASFYITLKRL